jgi:anaerobic magnesium-protoporphyrin IX monomethyl ester cyclase
MNKLKIAICYPPLPDAKGIPLIGQNRQFQWANSPWRAYPMVPAYAASLLKEKGYEVVWMDATSEGWSKKEFEKRLKEENLNLIVFEVKTPVIKRYWKVVNDIVGAGLIPARPITVFVGDHVTALPEESMENCMVDYILTGGDYDFSLLNLCNHLTKGEKLAPGVWFRITSSSKLQASSIKSTGKFTLEHNLNELPLIDRKLTRWELYSKKNSNYKHTPGSYTMFARDCWYGKCTFCVWNQVLFPHGNFRVLSVKKAIEEVENLVNNFGVREIMDDAGTFPCGEWLREFCNEIIRKGLNKKVTISCNMRFNSGLTEKDYELLGKANFRFLLYGLESANQETLEKIHKDMKVEQIEQTLTWAKKYGMEPHLTVMVGYPWEKKQEVENSLNLAKDLFNRGLADSLQATIVVPYPGTELFEECKKNNWLLTEDWDRYDMTECVMKTPFPSEELQAMVREFYSFSTQPKFIVRKILKVRTWDDIKQLSFFGYKFLSKLLDFSRK